MRGHDGKLQLGHIDCTLTTAECIDCILTAAQCIGCMLTAMQCVARLLKTTGSMLGDDNRKKKKERKRNVNAVRL